MVSDASAHPPSRAARSNGASSAPLVDETVASVVEMEECERTPQTAEAKLAEGITAFSGTLAFAALNGAWFVIWVLWNSGIAGLPVFDPYPFTFLTFAVSLEAIFLSTFVLISQNRQSVRSDHRSMIDLQVNVIAERELTKILTMVAEVHEHLTGRTGSGQQRDPEIEQMLDTLRIEELEQGTNEAEQASAASESAP
jgi:uncharacterized membrane protein